MRFNNTMNYVASNVIIVTRHAGLVEFLRQCGIEGDVITHAD